MPLNVVFCDNHLLVVDKPAGMLTQPDGSGEENLEDLAKAWVKEQFQKPGAVFLEPVHRLDKPVSGLVLFARTSKALSRLHAMMRDREILKIYYAKVERLPAQKEGTLEHFLVHDDFQARVVPANSPGAKKAILHYRIIGPDLLEITLHTGRYHQIRAQLAAIGSPIVGDAKYGGRLFFSEGIALHHGRMQFVHPVTKETVTFESKPLFE